MHPPPNPPFNPPFNHPFNHPSSVLSSDGEDSRCDTPSSIDSCSSSFVDFCASPPSTTSHQDQQNQQPQPPYLQSSQIFHIQQASSSHPHRSGQRQRTAFSTSWQISFHIANNVAISVVGLFRTYTDLSLLVANPAFDPEAWHFDDRGNLIYVPRESWREAKRWMWKSVKRRGRAGRSGGAHKSKSKRSLLEEGCLR